MKNFIKAIWPNKVLRFVLIFAILFAISSIFHISAIFSPLGLLTILHSVILPAMVLCFLSVLYETPNK